MKLILVSILLLNGLSNTNLIKQIRNEYDLINKSLDSYAKIENDDINVYKDLNPDNYSIESVEIYRLAVINMIRYYDKGEIKKIIVKFDGDRQDLMSEYYYINGTMIFAFKTLIDYKKPKWSDDFNESDKDIFENRFYFNDNKLIKWIDSDKNVVDLSAKDSTTVKLLLHDSELYQNYSKP